MKNAKENSLSNKEHLRLLRISNHHSPADRNLLERHEHRGVCVHRMVTIGQHTVGLQDYTYICNVFQITTAKPFPQYANKTHTHTHTRTHTRTHAHRTEAKSLTWNKRKRTVNPTTHSQRSILRM